ncbi:hypothetical protein ACH5RR_012420 [Cinchona calisaya]|uniref:Uncharacterized protein n=1 Tax=Cinchona calisaya TaxID=153742 RepID=A0ABD3A984_9GENT
MKEFHFVKHYIAIEHQIPAELRLVFGLVFDDPKVEDFLVGCGFTKSMKYTIGLGDWNNSESKQGRRPTYTSCRREIPGHRNDQDGLYRYGEKGSKGNKVDHVAASISETLG